MKLNSIDFFNKWTHYLSQEGSTWYSEKDRMDNLDMLISMFFNAGISRDEAESYRKKCMMRLTHEEGRKGNGKYKGWKEKVFNDFHLKKLNFKIHLGAQKPPNLFSFPPDKYCHNFVYGRDRNTGDLVPHSS